MNIQAVLFDLDGTLADTALDLGGALNALLRAKRLPEKKLVDIRPYASHGSGALLEFGAGITPEHPDFETWRQEYLAQYDLCFDKDTVLFDGVSVKPMLYACEKINRLPENCLYVGDAQRDIQAGQNSGMISVLAEWGYIADTDDVESWHYDYAVRQPLDILDILDIVERHHD